MKLTDKAAMDRQGFNLVDFVDVGVECTLRQLLEHGYFHADPYAPWAVLHLPSAAC